MTLPKPKIFLTGKTGHASIKLALLEWLVQNSREDANRIPGKMLTSHACHEKGPCHLLQGFPLTAAVNRTPAGSVLMHY